MSRLKSRNLFALAGRGRAIIKDFSALCALTPLASALHEMTPNAAIAPAVRCRELVGVVGLLPPPKELQTVSRFTAIDESSRTS